MRVQSQVEVHTDEWRHMLCVHVQERVYLCD
jgi:hypothetical protein